MLHGGKWATIAAHGRRHSRGRGSAAGSGTSTSPPDQRKAFWAAYLGWTLDGFDYYILSLLLVDVQRSFTVSSALAGALATVTLMFRVLGGIGAGIAADRWGRKLPLMLGILWYSSFAFLSAFSTSYGMLFACRALFGVGMGGVWSAGMPLAIEHCPPRHRGARLGPAARRLRAGRDSGGRRLPVRLPARAAISPKAGGC